ncbi:hypothetical protein ACJ41O_010305 [Fusarium nematophilum]
MGVGPNGASGSAFSKDVLVLEIAGPTQEHFSVIDVPGMFKRTTQGLTTKEDISLVDNMVQGYMANPRSVMLVVVPCNADIATQEVLEVAEDLDPEGDRTLGVLTKPDLMDKGSENDVVELIENKRHQLKLGWHLLRNPGQAELADTTKSRNSLEDDCFDQCTPWNALDKTKVGIEALRIRLQDILAAHIRREFPKVKSEISEKLRKANQARESLGPRRRTTFEQTQFLMDIAVRFQEITSSALRAHYGVADFFGRDDSSRLATAVVNRGETFAAVMLESGHKFRFGDSDQVGDITELKLDGLSLLGENNISSRLVTDSSDIQDLVAGGNNISKPHRHDILGWLKSVYRRSRGFELGTFDSSILLITMQDQAEKWKDLALGYVSDVIALVHAFIMGLLQYLVPSKRQLDGLGSLLYDALRERYRAALAQAEFLLEVELGGTPATYNHYFNDTLNKCRQERLKAQLSDKALNGYQHGQVIRLDDIVQNHPLSNDDQVVREIHDILKSYYKLSRKRFVDNVRMQAADHFLVTGSDTPLKLFSPKFVTSLTASQLEEVAGEESGVKRRRAQLDKEIRLLEEGMRILRDIADPPFSSEGLSLARANLGDIPAIKTIVDAAYSKYIERIGKPPAPMTADYAALLETHAIFVLKTNNESTVVGSIILGEDADSDSIKINNLVVDVTAQGRGYGGMLMRYAEGFAKARGRPALTLFTNIKMYENLGLYAKMGFVETERRTEAGYERVYFRKDL